MIGLWVSLAGAVGAMGRFSVDSLVKTRWRRSFPIATLIINVSGSLLLGVLTGLVLHHGAPPDLKLVAGTGFCGGYTTFSTASFESVRLLQKRAWLAALANVAGTAALTVLAAWTGLELT